MDDFMQVTVPPDSVKWEIQVYKCDHKLICYLD